MNNVIPITSARGAYVITFMAMGSTRKRVTLHADSMAHAIHTAMSADPTLIAPVTLTRRPK